MADRYARLADGGRTAEEETQADRRLEGAADHGRLIREQSRRIAILESEVRTLSATLDRAERTIADIARRFTAAMKKNHARRLRQALKMWFSRPPVATYRYNLIRNSVFFDKDYYLDANPDVKEGKLDPIVHYLQFGGKEGRDPGPRFSEVAYRAMAPDLAATSLSALEHYESHGRNEGQRLLIPEPRSDHAAGHPAAPGAAALRQAIERSGLFDPEIYLDLNEDLRLTGADPWAHFLDEGFRSGRPFTNPDLVAGALSRLAPDIQEEARQVTERLSAESGEKDIASAAAPLIASGAKVAVYCNSAGNFFFQEIANLVHWQLTALNIRSELRTEESDSDEPFDIRIFVAPHEFFMLGGGTVWRRLAGAPGSVLYNTEQPQTRWFGAAAPYLIEAPLVWDLNLQTSVLSRQLGCRSIYYAPPYLPACPYTLPQLDVSTIDHLRGYAFSRGKFDWTKRPGLAARPIDVLFVGTGCERRLRAIESLRELTDKHRFLCIYTHQTTPLSDANQHTRNIGVRNLTALAQRSKIVLNIHRDWIGYFEWPRMVMHGLWQGACVVSDPSFPDPVFAPGEHFLEEATRHLPELLRWLLGAPDGQRKMEEIAAAGYRRAASDGARAAMLAPMLTALRTAAGAGRT